jgi:prepilin-type N-terminal cleavage/methylation domain-containing protein
MYSCVRSFREYVSMSTSSRVGQECPTYRRAGFTLIELTMSIVIVSILLLALGSTLTLTLYATGDAATATAKNARSAELADQLCGDLGVALNFTERTASAVTFTVPDRDGDGLPDQLRYAVVGNLLTRQYQANPAATIASDVRLFNLSYLTRTAPSVVPVETLLTSFDNPAIGTSTDFAVDTTYWVSQYFVPAPPAGVSTWAITRVRFRMHAAVSTNDGVLTVQIRTANAAGMATSTILAQQNLYECAMPAAYGWVDVPIAVQGLSAGQGVCVTVGKKSGTAGTVGYLQYQDNSATIVPGYYFATSGNSASTWNTPKDRQAMRFYVYGSWQ